MATKRKEPCTLAQSATKSSQQPDAGRLARFLFGLHKSVSLLLYPAFSRPFLCLCHSLSCRFSHLWIKSANPHCDNSGISPPFHCAILALRRHRLLSQRLDTHAAVVKTRRRCGVLQDIEDVTECGPASAADQTDFCAVVLGLGRPFVCRVYHYGLQTSVLLCSVSAEVFASPQICSDCPSEFSEWPLCPSLHVFICECF